MSGASADPARRARLRRRRWLWIVAATILVGVAATAFLRGRGGPPAADIVAEPLSQGRFVREATGSGVVEAVRERALAFRSGGTVADVRVEEGDPVAAGDTLIRLDVAEIERNVASTRASLASARADLERTEAQLRVDRLDVESAVGQAEDRRLQAASELRDREAGVARVTRLLELGAASRDEAQAAQDARDAAARALEQAELALEAARSRLANQRSLADAQVSSAEARVAQLETELANLEARIGDAMLAAPFDGVVATLAVEPGDAAGTQPVVTIADPTEVRVRASFDENRAGELAVGQPADIVPDADTRARLPATVTRLSPVAARDGGGAQVEAILAFDDGALDGPTVRPGYTVTARVRVAELDTALLVPLESITEPDEDGAYVYRVEPGEEPGVGTVRRVDIDVLDRNVTVAAVDPEASELAEGTPIAVVGVDAIADGAAVRYPPLPEGDARDGP